MMLGGGWIAMNGDRAGILPKPIESPEWLATIGENLVVGIPLLGIGAGLAALAIFLPRPATSDDPNQNPSHSRMGPMD